MDIYDNDDKISLFDTSVHVNTMLLSKSVLFCNVYMELPSYFN